MVHIQKIDSEKPKVNSHIRVHHKEIVMKDTEINLLPLRD